MKTIGLIGGMSWESSLEYYRIINEKVQKELGGLHSAPCILYSVDFQDIERLQHKNDWEGLARIMINAAQKLEKAGAELILIATNTMHKVARQVEENVGLPLLHIADATAAVIQQKSLKKLALLGTKFTMEENFYRGRMKEKYNLDILVPNQNDRNLIHGVIYKELCLGNILESSKQAFLNIINQLILEGAEGIILGCTEIPLLIKQADVSVPVFDTTTIHAEAAVLAAIE